ncbi:hypothetical protein NQ176_g6277 [Zarea fungicola]|uniref:Uncharacterized protein n=1 Tax=Zarea fungicola TaxID=93591 RepID=A0ACC1N6E9_9HYPO|nr:hypothetical protein NQ176_g6277 [Lecanicillium fungicola]
MHYTIQDNAQHNPELFITVRAQETPTTSSSIFALMDGKSTNWNIDAALTALKPIMKMISLRRTMTTELRLADGSPCTVCHFEGPPVLQVPMASMAMTVLGPPGSPMPSTHRILC